MIMRYTWLCISIVSSYATTSEEPVCDLYKDIVIVPLVRANHENLQGYGRIVYPHEFDNYQVEITTWPQPDWRPIDPGTGNQGGTTQGTFTMEWKNGVYYAINKAVGGSYCTGWLLEENLPLEGGGYVTLSSHVVIWEANYHPDGGQLVVPIEHKPFVALLALPGDNVKPEDFVAFYCDGTFGIEILPCVWHQPFYSKEQSMTFNDKQSKVHACISVNFPQEFNCYLAVPLDQSSIR